MTDIPPPAPAPGRSSFWLIVRALQVRLRFVLVLLFAFLCVGQWDRLQRGWDRAVRSLSGQMAAGQGVSSDTEYFCPMDPGVLSDWPSICPICNMSLVRRKKGEAALLPEGVVARMQLSPYRIQLAGIKTSTIDYRSSDDANERVLVVPETAVVDMGDQKIVYVETMPGMFDGLEVTLGPRSGDMFPVLRGLEGRAESGGSRCLPDRRRGPAQPQPGSSLLWFRPEWHCGRPTAGNAHGRRGLAAGRRSQVTPPGGTPPLSDQDQALADLQRICPVTDLSLNAMGGAVPVVVAGKKVFICCRGCEGKLKSDPEKYLAKLHATHAKPPKVEAVPAATPTAAPMPPQAEPANGAASP